MGSSAPDAEHDGGDEQPELFAHRDTPHSTSPFREDFLGKRGKSERERGVEGRVKRWSKGQRERRQGRCESSGGEGQPRHNPNPGTLPRMWRHPLEKRMSSTHQSNYLPELLQTGTSRKPMSQQHGRRFDYVQVLRRCRAHKERLSKQKRSCAGDARYKDTQKKCVVTHRDVYRKKNIC